LFHTGLVRMYKVRIWAFKTEIVGIAPFLGWPCRIECCPVPEYGGMLL
jgi:hypothetical protein